jgi:acyl-CoA thioesterase FadM
MATSTTRFTSNYLEHARWKLLEDEGITRARFAEWKTWPVVAGLEAQYLRPLLMGQKIEIETQVVEGGRVFFTCAQTILHEGKPVFRAKVRLAMVNEQGRPTPMLEEMAQLFGVGS